MREQRTRKSQSVCLVLMAGGVAISLAGGCEDRRARECAEARAQMRPDAEQICARSSSSSRSSHYWLFGRSSGGSPTVQGLGSNRASAPAASSRGGFGSSARAGS